MTKETTPTPLENLEYTYLLIGSLTNENNKLKEAIKDVLEVLNKETGVPNIEWIKHRLTETLKN